MTVATRTEVGLCDLGNVFIFAQTSADGERWMVRAGNHTIGTYDSESQAEAVARTLCGDDRLIARAEPATCENCPHAPHEGGCTFRTATEYCDCGHIATDAVPEVEDVTPKAKAKK